MKLYIAEKPSLARAIVEALPQPARKEDGYYTCANGDRVSWCIGHLLEQAEPEDYSPEYKKWSAGDLPIIPEAWRLKPKPKTAKQLSVLRKLVKEADVLVHAGDPDREGQLLVDEVINHLKVSKKKQQATQRLLISDLNKPAVTKALNNLRSNAEFVALSSSALARSRADWLFGLNLTRAYTLQGQKVGYRGVLSVGRVQTPLLGLVVRRDQAVDDFIQQPFFDVWAKLSTDTVGTISSTQTDPSTELWAKWQPSAACENFLDEKGRNLSAPLAQNVAGRIEGKPASVQRIKKQPKCERAPLPHSLSSLQIEAGKVFGLSAKQVLDLCQSLYEKHKVITYPRSDARHLPAAHFAQAQDTIDAVIKQSGLSEQGVLKSAEVKRAPLDASIKSHAWNDAKVDAHHAIAPTLKCSAALSANEAKVYSLVGRQYLAQFLTPHETELTEVDVLIETGHFVAKSNRQVNLGWKYLWPKRKSQSTDGEAAFVNQCLPEMATGQALVCTKGLVNNRLTSPPKPFTDATLLAAMTGINKHVQDPTLKKILRDTDGLGTEATRAGIIELLFKRDFLCRQGKAIRATPAGKAFIQALPDRITWPDMTARWEATMADICERQAKYADLMNPVVSELHQLVEQSQQVLPVGLKGLQSKGAGFKRKARTGVKKSARKVSGAGQRKRA